MFTSKDVDEAVASEERVIRFFFAAIWPRGFGLAVVWTLWAVLALFFGGAPPLVSFVAVWGSCLWAVAHVWLKPKETFPKLEAAWAKICKVWTYVMAERAARRIARSEANRPPTLEEVRQERSFMMAGIDGTGQIHSLFETAPAAAVAPVKKPLLPSVDWAKVGAAGARVVDFIIRWWWVILAAVVLLWASQFADRFTGRISDVFKSRGDIVAERDQAQGEVRTQVRVNERDQAVGEITVRHAERRGQIQTQSEIGHAEILAATPQNEAPLDAGVITAWRDALDRLCVYPDADGHLPDHCSTSAQV